MSINDILDSAEAVARVALVKAGAIKPCPFHSDVTIWLGDTDADRHAYAIATNTLKRDGSMWLREEVMGAIKHELDMAADGECPQCAHMRDS